jgi:hypothetical protein
MQPPRGTISAIETACSLENEETGLKLLGTLLVFFERNFHHSRFVRMLGLMVEADA